MENATPQACPIQRLLIFHVNLAKLCTGQGLGESASAEEWHEHILYYYQDESLLSLGGSSASESNSNYDTVQFASLCIALSNLPKAFNRGDPTTSNDQTQEVHLDRSTLVFVPLETLSSTAAAQSGHDNTNILAVAQISRSGKGGGCDPLAVRLSLERWHRLFCLLRDGSIHYRLSARLGESTIRIEYRTTSATTRGSSYGHSCIYPGMDQLFERYERLRCLREAIGRSSHEPSITQQPDERQLGDDIESLKKALPITSVRIDLAFHYDTFIGDFAVTSERLGGVGRCLVETIPAPVALESGGHASKWTPVFPPPQVTFHLSQAIRTLLSPQSHNSDNNLRLHAISTFYQSQLLYHHECDGSFAEDNPTSCLVMWYMASYSFTMQQQQQNQQAFAAASPPRRISRGLVSYSDQVSVASGVESVDPGGHGPETFDDDHRGRFLQTPPLAMLSASEQKTVSVRGPDNELVWAPLVCRNQGRGADERDIFEKLHVIFYEWRDFRFLLYIPPSEQTTQLKEDDISSASLCDTVKDVGIIGSLLETIATALHECLSLHMAPVSTVGNTAYLSTTVATESQQLLSSAIGRDVIFVARKSNCMLVLPRLASKESKKRTDTLSPMRLMSIFRPKVSNIPEGNVMKAHRDIKTWASEGFDCRHWLAAHIPSDALVALDDVMNDIYCHKRRARTARCRGVGGILGGNYEVLTPLTIGWIYAFADEWDNEIYMLLDIIEYPTIASAQRAIAQVGHALL
jgi:hypothetical protein